jgi:hypothetical protein
MSDAFAPSAVFFICPGCTHTLRVDAGMAGGRTACPSCGSPLTVPAVSQHPLGDSPLVPPVPQPAR